MSEVTAATSVPPPLPSQPAARGRLPVRTYLLAGCSVGGTLCASLASSPGVNVPFAVLSAVFGGLIVVLTAAPGVAAAAASATPAAVGVVAVGQPAAMRSPGTGSVAIGVSAGVLSFIMNQVAQFATGLSVFGVVGMDFTAEEMLFITSLMGLSVYIVKFPFDLLLGAYLMTRARNIFAALGMLVVTYFGCYVIEQLVSATMGASGLLNTISVMGLEPVLWGMLMVLGLPLLAQGVGAFGAKITAYLMGRRA